MLRSCPSPNLRQLHHCKEPFEQNNSNIPKMVSFFSKTIIVNTPRHETTEIQFVLNPLYSTFEISKFQLGHFRPSRFFCADTVIKRVELYHSAVGKNQNCVVRPLLNVTSCKFTLIMGIPWNRTKLDPIEELLAIRQHYCIKV